LAVTLELGLAQCDESFEIGRRSCSIHEAKSLVDFEIEDIARLLKQIERMETPAQLDEDEPYAAEKPGPLEAQVFTIAHSSSGMTQHPAKQQPSQGTKA